MRLVRMMSGCAAMIAVLFCGSVAVAQESNALGAHWSFDEGAGDTVGNASSAANSGTIVGGATWIAGRVGAGALALDGVDDAVIIADSDDYTFNHTHTIMGWFRADREGQSGAIFSKGNGNPLADFPESLCADGPNTDPNNEWGSKRIYLNTEGQLTTNNWVISGAAVTSDLPYDDGEWHHFAIVVQRGVVRPHADAKDATPSISNRYLNGAGDLEMVTITALYVDGFLVEQPVNAAGERDPNPIDSDTHFLGNPNGFDGTDTTPRDEIHDGAIVVNSRYHGEANVLARGGYPEGPCKIGLGRPFENARNVVVDVGPDGEEGTADDVSARVHDTYFAGAVDDFRIFPAALTQEQIEAAMNGADFGCAAGAVVCDSITVEEGDGYPGKVTVTANAAGEGHNYYIALHRQGDGGRYALTEDMQAVVLEYSGPSNSWEFFAPAGEYVAVAAVTGNALCVDAPTCTSEPFTVNRAPNLGRRVSESAGGVQYWMDFEDFTRGLPAADAPGANGETIADFKRAFPSDGAFGNAFHPIDRTAMRENDPTTEEDDCFFQGGDLEPWFLGGAAGWRLDYDFDISHAGGEEGEYVSWQRSYNPNNLAEYGLMAADPDDQGQPTEPFENGLWPGRGQHPAIGNDADDQIFEETHGPAYGWAVGAGRGLNQAGNVKQLSDGLNTWSLYNRQGSSMNVWDVWVWTSDPNFVPSDELYKAATALSRFLRGDCNGDGAVDLSDGVNALNFSFLGGARPACLEACDFNATGLLDITNAVFFFNALFQGGPSIRPPNDCDVAAPFLGCETPTC